MRRNLRGGASSGHLHLPVRDENNVVKIVVVVFLFEVGERSPVNLWVFCEYTGAAQVKRRNQ